ncbi:MAG: alpha-glucan family phosphorylase [Bryobacteraceae bacterium]|nr:alpha-glucan family phosphorylase [Bryobacteraceae bacterium]MDW8379346.1 alpha-glucan family phosphorylase [Bryobacterales bacterium]
MPFELKPVKEFLVLPAVPDELSRLSELAYNVIYSWDHNIRAVFRRLDPVLWKSCGHNPVLMLGQIPQSTLERMAKDQRYRAVYRKACEVYDAYMSRPVAKGKLIAYFSMEYGLLECMPIYSGGLGVLSGDHLKSASDAQIPLVGVGLLYQRGYLQQRLNPDGWQTERNPENDFYTLPVLPVLTEDGTQAQVTVTLPTGEVVIKIWCMNVGQVKLYLLDTNVPENTVEENRDITDQLYGGDIHTRIRQEIVLGIGGMRALRALGLHPTVFHMNEGHSAFLALEHIKLLMREQGLSFEEAWEAARRNQVFTTHTPVPAGIDLFDTGLMYMYFRDYCQEAGFSFEQLMGLGKRNGQNAQEPFSMAILALQTSSYRNAVSQLHRRVSQQMWSDLWPDLPTWEVPITSVTNGVHLPTWLNGDLATIYDNYLAADWRDHHTDPKTWELVKEIPSAELWEARRHRKRMLITFVRERLTAQLLGRKASASELRRVQDTLDPDAFTIGFARRFATYKRATLLFRDVARLKRILLNPKMPVQILYAGKAHPKDHPGKLLIREIFLLTRDPEISRRLVFIEDYGIEVARELIQGVDLWLNTPRRGEEACGTSGMKAGLNGVLNLSILDGWFDEAYEYSGCWAIGDREPYTEDQDEIHASSIYSLLENEIVPMYYDRKEEGFPEEWMRRVKQCLMNLSPRFNSTRMLEEYDTQLYEPAHQAFLELERDHYQSPRQRALWNHYVRRVWDQVRIVDVDAAAGRSVLTGQAVTLRAVVELAGLRPSDLKVEAVVGRVGAVGHLEETQVMTLAPVGERGSAYEFATQFVPVITGRLGYAMRVSPNDQDDPLCRPCYTPIRWS